MFSKNISIILLLLLISSFSLAEVLEIGKGALKMGTILQTTFSWNQTELFPETSFTMKRARFLFYGTIIPDKVKYFIQSEVVSSPCLLDTKLQFFYIPKTEITVGRFLPNFTYYMPMLTSKLDMINYPLIVTTYTVWRQVGIQTTTNTKYVDFNIGMFNGYPSNNWSDNNDAKDVFLRITAKPLNKMQIFAYGWFGNALFASDTDLAANRFGIGFSIEKEITESKIALVLRGEYLIAKDDTADNVKIDSRGYYLHIGFKPRPNIEVLFRYDSIDPNTDVDYNKKSWTTGGINYYISGTSVMLYLNYIHKNNEIAPGFKDPKDDEVILQAQIAF